MSDHNHENGERQQSIRDALKKLQTFRKNHIPEVGLKGKERFTYASLGILSGALIAAGSIISFRGEPTSLESSSLKTSTPTAITDTQDEIDYPLILGPKCSFGPDFSLPNPTPEIHLEIYTRGRHGRVSTGNDNLALIFHWKDFTEKEYLTLYKIFGGNSTPQADLGIFPLPPRLQSDYDFEIILRQVEYLYSKQLTIGGDLSRDQYEGMGRILGSYNIPRILLQTCS